MKSTGGSVFLFCHLSLPFSSSFQFFIFRFLKISFQPCLRIAFQGLGLRGKYKITAVTHPFIKEIQSTLASQQRIIAEGIYNPVLACRGMCALALHCKHKEVSNSRCIFIAFSVHVNKKLRICLINDYTEFCKCRRDFVFHAYTCKNLISS